MEDNEIEDAEIVPRFFENFDELIVLRLEGNPCVSQIEHYKKTLMRACRKLTMLDDMTVSDMERMRAEKERGDEWEQKDLQSQLTYQQSAKEKENFGVEKMIDRGRRFDKMREQAFDQMKGELTQIKSDLPEKHNQLKAKYDELDTDTKEGADNYRAMIKCEDDMKLIWFKMLLERGEDVPEGMGL